MGHEQADDVREGELVNEVPSNVRPLRGKRAEEPDESPEERKERAKRKVEEEKKAARDAAVKGLVQRMQQQRQERQEHEAEPGEGQASVVMKYEYTDMGNADRLEHHYGDVLRYIDPWRQWIWWDDQRWQKDQTQRIEHYAQQTVLAIIDELAYAETVDEMEKIIEHYRSSQSSGKIGAMIKQARNKLALDPRLLLESAHHLVSGSGIVDLRTGQLCPPDTEDYSLLWTRVPYDPTARCPRWERFIAEVMGQDQEMMDLLQRTAGYSATGFSSEQALLIFAGTGNNGKGVFLRTISRVLGDYAMAANPDFLHRRRYTGHPTDIIQLQGSRLVVVSELAAGEGLDESRTKLLTGSDVLRGRGIAKDFTQFEPTFTIILQTNHLPVVTSQDEGMWRRLQVIPWTQQWVLPGREGLLPGRPVADPTLEDQLKEELRGILGWCVRGAQQWFERGLDFPKTVREATLAYRKEQDQLAAFALACLVPEEGARSNVSAVYDAYCRFQKQQGQAALSQTAFGTAMAKRYKRQHFANANYYMNVRLVEPPQKDDEKTGA